MKFEKGHIKTAGRKKGTPNKKTVLRIAEYIATKDIQIAAEIWKAVLAIEEPAEQAKAMLAIYKFIEPEAKEPLSADDDEVDGFTDILSLVTPPRDGA